MVYKITVGVVIVLAWVALTIGTVVGYQEWQAHGAQHAYVKQMMETKDHEVLKEVVQFLNSQLQAQQKAAKPAQ